jgi:OOP family OmpA-OmpF porin
MYSFLSKIVAIILFLLLILLWIFGRGPTSCQECCDGSCDANTQSTVVINDDANSSDNTNLLVSEINTSKTANSDSNNSSKSGLTDVICSDKMSLAVSFSNASTTLSDDSKKMLDQVVNCIKDGSYEIAGYTDSAGEDAMNMRLSEVRAQSTKDYLLTKGVDGAKLTVKGYGESKPIATNHTKEGRAKNRHIEFIKQ